MLKSYLRIGWRNLLRNKGYSIINIGGLALGMSVAILIGLWIYDELSFNKYHENYDRIARVMQHATRDGKTGTGMYMPFPLAAELVKSFENDFDHVVMSTFPSDHIISNYDQRFTESGNYMSPDAPEMLTLKMLRGTRYGLKELNSIMLSTSLARRLFGNDDPLNKTVTIDIRKDLKVTGVYEDLPTNSEFHSMAFIAPWDLYVATNDWVVRSLDSWDHHNVEVLVQLAPLADVDLVSNKIKNIIYDRESEEFKIFQRKTFLHPMSKWHLYEEFDNGVNAGGRIQYVWLFGIIGIFVLLLACINFMNLSTARSETRAKEVGIRKAIGSFRSQLIKQFFSESLLVAAFAFVLSIGLVFLSLPWFNEIASKQIYLPWQNVYFWLSCIGFTLFTGILAGSYPAFYLSSFQAVKVLNGTFKAGRFASVPRQVLVVLQFTVSVTLILGTITVYHQIQHTKERPLGYNNGGLIYLNMRTPEVHEHFQAVRDNLIKSGAIIEMAESNNSIVSNLSNAVGFEWKDKDPGLRSQLNVERISPEFGKTIGWNFSAGRDFSRDVVSDQSGIIVSESTVDYMGLKDPVGEIIKWEGKDFTILGVVKDLVVGSPYQPTTPTVYMPLTWTGNVVSLKLNPNQSTDVSLKKVQTTFSEFTSSPFDYKFADEQYAYKFSNEVRIGQLATVFAILSVFISCVGLFGMASFAAVQRTKELGIRKILGASITNLWQMLSKDFVVLVIISCTVATPLSYYFMNSWLESFQYRTTMSIWMFVSVSAGALLITLLVVSFQTLKAAIGNPIKSLRSE